MPVVFDSNPEKNFCPKKTDFEKILHTMIEIKKEVEVNDQIICADAAENLQKLKRGEEMYCTFKESPFAISEELRSNFSFINYMQYEKTNILPPNKDAVPFIGWYRYCGLSTYPDPEDNYMYPKPKNQNDLVFAEVEVPEIKSYLVMRLVGQHLAMGNTIRDRILLKN